MEQFNNFGTIHQLSTGDHATLIYNNKEEVDALMSLMVMAIEQETPDLMKNNVRLTAIGDLDRMPAEVRERLDRCMQQTAANTGLTLVLALSYSARWELVRAARELAARVAQGRLQPEQIDEAMLSSALTTRAIPDPDLLIRTGGECRISNFLLWQAAYSEFYFTPVLWPDFTKEDLQKAVDAYRARKRRFGGV